NLAADNTCWLYSRCWTTLDQRNITSGVKSSAFQFPVAQPKREPIPYRSRYDDALRLTRSNARRIFCFCIYACMFLLIAGFFLLLLISTATQDLTGIISLSVLLVLFLIFAGASAHEAYRALREPPQ